MPSSAASPLARLTVRGHINGKMAFTPPLLVEMIAVTGKKLSQIARDIEEEYGAIHMEERDYKFSQGRRIRSMTPFNPETASGDGSGDRQDILSGWLQGVL